MMSKNSCTPFIDPIGKNEAQKGSAVDTGTSHVARLIHPEDISGNLRKHWLKKNFCLF